MKYSPRILFIGPYSSVGGVSEHIKRLSNILKEEYNVRFIDESKLVEDINIVHIHTRVWWLRFTKG